MASLFGAPANTTYGENTGVLALTRVFDPRVVRIAAGFAILLSFCPEFAAVISCMPACVIGGVSSAPATSWRNGNAEHLLIPHLALLSPTARPGPSPSKWAA